MELVVLLINEWKSHLRAKFMHGQYTEIEGRLIFNI